MTEIFDIYIPSNTTEMIIYFYMPITHITCCAEEFLFVSFIFCNKLLFFAKVDELEIFSLLPRNFNVPSLIGLVFSSSA